MDQAAYLAISFALWMVIALIFGSMARARGYSYWLGVLASVALSPLVALVVLLILPKRAMGTGTSLEERCTTAMADAYRASDARKAR